VVVGSRTIPEIRTAQKIRPAFRRDLCSRRDFQSGLGLGLRPGWASGPGRLGGGGWGGGGNAAADRALSAALLAGLAFLTPGSIFLLARGSGSD